MDEKTRRPTIAIPEKEPTDRGNKRNSSYRRLFRKFVFLTTVCSVMPMLLVGWGIHLHDSSVARERMKESLKAQIENHRKMIQLFLSERQSELRMIAYSHSLAELTGGTKLQEIFDLINNDYWSFTDLGVIDDRGRHLQYIGPYDLMDKNYSGTFWFDIVMEKGYYISDMFMGFRKEPHFVIAVARNEGGRKWLVRATINTEYFRSLVENVRIGQTGEVCLVNLEGIFQTTPRFSGRIMGKAPFPIERPVSGTIIKVIPESKNSQGERIPKKIETIAWLDEPAWMLLIRQDYAEAFDDVNHANRITLIFLHIMVAAIFIAAALITRHMISIIKKRDVEAEQLNNQLMQTGKLAAIGELSAGVAHEINNPLAIILTERQLLLDACGQSNGVDEALKSQIHGSLSQIDIQVQRCKRITQNLLRFARRTESVIEAININTFLMEIVDLIEREAKTSGIRFITDLEDNLPTVYSDPSQLQQVFLNMITNAIDAHDGKPYGTIRITTENKEHGGVGITFEDTGSGIPPEIMNRIFDPFFSTKPVGKGTGLGLSICYSIMRRLGGGIDVDSAVGQWTRFRLYIPVDAPRQLQDSLRPKKETAPPKTPPDHQGINWKANLA